MSEELKRRLESIAEEIKPALQGRTVKVTHYDPIDYMGYYDADDILAGSASQFPYYKIVMEEEKQKRVLFVKFRHVESTELALVCDHSEPWVGVEKDKYNPLISRPFELPGLEKVLFFKIPKTVPEAVGNTIASRLTDFASANNYQIVR